MIRGFLILGLVAANAGCATYNYASNVKTIAFSDDVTKGVSMGNIHGEDCTWSILGYQMGGLPTIDRAFEHVRDQTDGGSLAGSLDTHQSSKGGVRYINNVSSKNDGFNAVIFGKTCLAVTGVGYK